MLRGKSEEKKKWLWAGERCYYLDCSVKKKRGEGLCLDICQQVVCVLCGGGENILRNCFIRTNEKQI